MSDRCPGTGLEGSVVAQEAAGRPGSPWPFLQHINSTGRGEPHWVVGATVAGDPDLLMHYAVTRAHGRAVHGPPASAMFGEVPRVLVLDYLRTELDWGLEHGTESYAVLNALRAMAYAQERVLLSKVQAGLRTLETVDLPSAVIQRALRARQGDTEPSPPGTEAAGLIRRVRAVLAAAQVDAGDAPRRARSGLPQGSCSGPSGGR